MVISSFLYKSFEKDHQIVYVDNNKLFDGFKMTTEMKRIGEKEFNLKKIVLDSLYTKLQSPIISEIEKKTVMQQFIQKKEALQEFNQDFAREESYKIWTRIYSYTIDFSKEKKYQLIIGSENKRPVLYATESIDVTNELLAYINKKYEGVQ